MILLPSASPNFCLEMPFQELRLHGSIRLEAAELLRRAG